MDKLTLLCIVFCSTVLFSDAQEFIQIVGYMKIPGALKLFVDQFGHSGPPRAVFTPLNPAGSARNSELHSAPGNPAVGSSVSSLANFLRQLRGSGAAETGEGPPVRPPQEAESAANPSASFMRSLMAGAQQPTMNFNPNSFTSGFNTAAEAEQPPTSKTIANRFGTAGSSSSANLLQLLQSQRGSSADHQMLDHSTNRDLTSLTQNIPSSALAARLQELLGASPGRAKRQVTQSGSASQMNDILAQLKLQLKNALQKRLMQTQPQPTSNSEVTFFGATKVLLSTQINTTPNGLISKPAISNKAPNIQKSSSRSTTNNTQTSGVNMLRTSNRESTSILNQQYLPKSNSQPSTPIEQLNLLKSLPLSNALSGTGFSSFMSGGSPAMNQLSTGMLSTEIYVNCVLGRTMPLEATSLGPVSEIQRYDCIVPVKSQSQLVGTFSVQHGETMSTCNVDHDRVQIDGSVVQSMCIHN